jgi:serine/threonine protein phosphatase PrpC
MTRRIIKLRTSEVLWVASVADGAGSARHAEVGAQYACQSAERFLVANFHRLRAVTPQCLSAELVAYHCERLQRWSRPRQIPLRELASTLAAVAISDRGDWVAVHIGDGAILARAGEEIETISAPMKGAFANQTFFLTDPRAHENLRWVFGPGDRQSAEPQQLPITSSGPIQWRKLSPDAFLLFTDGLEPALLTSRLGAPAPAIKKMMDWSWQFPATTVRQALDWNLREVLATRSHDDCTLVMVNRTSPRDPFPGPEVTTGNTSELQE